MRAWRSIREKGRCTPAVILHVSLLPTSPDLPTTKQSSTTSARRLVPHARAMMRALPATLLVLLCAAPAFADDLVTSNRIKVQLFAAPAFVSEVSVDAYHNQCLSLDNNLYGAVVHRGHGCVLMAT